MSCMTRPNIFGMSIDVGISAVNTLRALFPKSFRPGDERGNYCHEIFMSYYYKCLTSFPRIKYDPTSVPHCLSYINKSLRFNWIKLLSSMFKITPNRFHTRPNEQIHPFKAPPWPIYLLWQPLLNLSHYLTAKIKHGQLEKVSQRHGGDCTPGKN